MLEDPASTDYLSDDVTGPSLDSWRLCKIAATLAAGDSRNADSKSFRRAKATGDILIIILNYPFIFQNKKKYIILNRTPGGVLICLAGAFDFTAGFFPKMPANLWTFFLSKIVMCLFFASRPFQLRFRWRRWDNGTETLRSEAFCGLKLLEDRSVGLN